MVTATMVRGCWCLARQDVIVGGVVKRNALQPVVAPGAHLRAVVLHLHGGAVERPVGGLGVLVVVLRHRHGTQESNVTAGVVVGEALTFLHADVVVRGAGAGGGLRVGASLAGGVVGVVVARGDAALDSLVGHHVQKLQGAFVALDVRNIDGHLVRRVGTLDVLGRMRVLVVRNVVQEDSHQLLILVQNGNAEGRSGVRNGLFPGESGPSGLQGSDRAEAPIARLGAAGSVFVSGIVELDVLTIRVICVSRQRAFPSSVAGNNCQVGTQNSSNENERSKHREVVRNRSVICTERDVTQG